MKNGYSFRSARNLSFALADGCLILLSILLGSWIRFWGREDQLLQVEYLPQKIMLVVAVVQIVFYYFDLYEFKSLRSRMKTGILTLEALGVSSVLLSVAYFAVPSLALGRGVFIISFLMILALTFFWRNLYPWIVEKSIFKERILIIGIGELAQKVQDEVSEHGQGAFEIVGFVAEAGERVGEKIGSEDYRGFQPDLFHLQRR